MGFSLGDAFKYIAQSSAYIANTAVDNAKTAGAAVSQAGGAIAGNKDLQNTIAGNVANGVATQNAMDAQQAATTAANQQVAAAKADTLAKQDDDLRKQARSSYGGLAGNILSGGRGVAAGAESASRILLGS